MAFTRAALCVLSLCIISAIAFETSEAQYSEFYARELDSTDESQYIARTGHSTIVVGDYLYLDGGEVYVNESGAVVVYPGLLPPSVWTLDNSRVPDQTSENSTYSFDLTFSWTNDTTSLPLYQTDKGDAPLLDSAALWKDSSNTSFYSYDGVLVANSGQSTPSNQLWQFIPDGSDSGFWNQSNTLANSIFPTLQRTQGQASTYGNGIGYALGGMDSNNVPIPGLVSYNTTSGLWSNMTTNGFTDSGTSMFGQLQYVPGFGEAGLLVALGGQTSGKAQWFPLKDLLSFQAISIFDPVSNIWASQVASGTLPPPRTHFCSVGVQGDNGTFEIFVYGGKPQGDNSSPPSQAELQAALDLDAVYVLSLPAFNWHKAAFTPQQSRAWHTCNVVGNRQMVVVGGKQPFLSDSSQPPDFLSQGFGIFDLSDMEWKDQYDAAAAPYVTPDVVKSWYSEHGQYPASWSNATVAAWFTPSAKQASSKIGVIAGAAFGIVVVLLLIGTAAWYFLRRRPEKSKERFVLRRQSHKLEGLSNANYHKSELDASGTVAHPYKNHTPELDSNSPVKYYHKTDAAELDIRRQPIEKDGWQVHEAPASPKYELP